MVLLTSTISLVALLFLLLGPARWLVTAGMGLLFYAYPLALVVILAVAGAIHYFTRIRNTHDLPRLPDGRD